jgi:O-antigen ligase
MRNNPGAPTPLESPATPADRAPTALDADRPGRASTTPRRTMSLAEPPIFLSPRAVVSSLFSFEALLVLYMFAGNYKADPRFAWIPIDPTALFFALSVAVGGLIIVRKGIHRKGLPVVFAMACLVAWLAVSLLWSPSRNYGLYKVFLTATLASWALMAGALIIAPSPQRVRRLFTLLLLFAIFMGIDAVLVYAESSGGFYRRETLEGSVEGRHLLLGRICGLGVLIALVGWLYARGRMAGRVCLVLFFALGFVLAIGGGRGPLIATALPLLIAIALSVRLPVRKILISRALLSVLVLLLAMPVGLALYTTATGQRLGTIDRLERLLTEGNPRTGLYAETIELSQRALVLGHGTGSWPVLAGYGDERNYPHNLFLEIVAENGLVGLILFLALVWVAFRPVSLERLRRDPQALCAMMLFANTLLNAMTTADLVGNRVVFMMLGLLALFAMRPGRFPAPAGAPRQPAAPPEVRIARGRHAVATEHVR